MQRCARRRTSRSSEGTGRGSNKCPAPGDGWPAMVHSGRAMLEGRERMTDEPDAPPAAGTTRGAVHETVEIELGHGQKNITASENTTFLEHTHTHKHTQHRTRRNQTHAEQAIAPLLVSPAPAALPRIAAVTRRPSRACQQTQPPPCSRDQSPTCSTASIRHESLAEWAAEVRGQQGQRQIQQGQHGQQQR